MMLKAADSAPEFTVQAHDGSELSLANLRGKKVLLWFYPEADTPGCSLEGRGFRDHQEYFDENNIQVIGASFNSVDQNAAFARKFDFKFPLACDVDRELALAYGACSDTRAQSPDRISFLIDEEGKIARVYDQVDPRDHPAKVLADILDV